MSHPSLADLHLPDLSESSFQIPLADTSDLLANDDDDFFQGANDSLSTPMPQRTASAHEPLTLSQLTPKPQHQRVQTFNTLSASAEVSTQPLKVPKVEPIKDDIGGSSGQQLKPKLKISTVPSFENLKKEVNTLFTDSGNSQPAKTLTVTLGRANSRPKPTVAAGGISKIPKNSSPACGITRTSKLVSSRPPEAILHDAEIDAHSPDPDQSYANTSVGSIAGNGVAERLLVYSQKFMPTHTLFNSEQPSVLESPSQDSSPDPRIFSHAGAPLTLSQVSPRKARSKEVANPRDGQNLITSPMRPSTKRPVSRTTTSSHQSKKGKGLSVPASVLQPSIRKNTSTAIRTNGLEPKAGPSRLAERNGKGREKGITNSASSGSQEAHCRQQGEVPRDVKLDTEAILEASQRSQPVMATRMPQFRTTHTTLHPTHPTRPVGFSFQLDSRLESRRLDPEDKGSRKAPQPALPVPDFKALHATQEAQLALRKEQIAPIYPLPIELNTESRAKEREKFDELIREKERETDRALEQRKKEKEAEEEREIREMRKKAVPKAHEVPRWYKEAPRRRDVNERLDVVG